MLIIEVVQNHDRPEQKKTTGEKPREYFQQVAYIHNGAAFPQKISLSFNSLTECLEVGKYTIDASSFRANQYGSLELDRYNMTFTKVTEQELRKVS